jgi:putative chitinase
MTLTPPIIQVGCGAPAPLASAWLSPLQAACAQFNINTPMRVAAFLATIGVESGHLSTLVENLNYSADGLANTWPSRYSTGQKTVAIATAAPRWIPNAEANGLARDPEAIANNCYAGRNGNGDEASGDGWKYRGRGPIQQTGRANYAACASGTGLDLVNHPELLEQPADGALAAAWFWSSNGLNTIADTGNFLAASRKVNLGNANSQATPLGWPERQALYTAVRKVLGV